MSEQPLVLVVVSGTSHDLTQGKFLFTAEVLRREGLHVCVLTWTEKAFEAAKARGFFAASVALQAIPMTPEARVQASKEAWALLDWPIAEQRGAPTWARLLALDDVIGGAQAWKMGNLEHIRPQVIVKANQGAESSTPEDEQMDLAISRWARANRIPIVALEVQRADDVLRLKWPVQVLLTKQDLLAASYAEETWRLPPAHRYFCQGITDPRMEEFLEHEPQLREKFGVVGKKVIFMPFHLYYIQECIEMLREIVKHQDTLKADGAKWVVVIGCGENFRRSYSERDIIGRGLVQAWKELGTVQIAEGVHPGVGAMLADIVALPYKSQYFQALARQHEVNCWEHGGDFLDAVQEARRVRGIAETVRRAMTHEHDG